MKKKLILKALALVFAFGMTFSGHTLFATTYPTKAQPFAAVIEQGVIELVGINETLLISGYSDEVEVILATPSSGEILKVCLIATEDATGAILKSTGTLFFFKSDPTVILDAPLLDPADWPLIFAHIPVLTEDWISETSGGIACFVRADSFPVLSSFFLVWFHTLGTSINSLTGDDEQLEVNIWYRRDS